MKTTIIILILGSVTYFKSSAQETIVDGKKLGLVSYLTYVKSLSEFKMTSLAYNEEYKIKLDKAKISIRLTTY